MRSEAEQQQRVRRLARLTFFERAGWFFSVVLVAVAIGTLEWMGRLAPVDRSARTFAAGWCAADYQRATSAADTEFIDQRKPATARYAKAALTSCGELRRAGLTR
jgi:hypothetical protein